jgi:predicted N-acetyltransferase YhbS
LQSNVCHLFEVPQHRQAVARLIHEEFWTQVPGASVLSMARRLEQADSADRLPLCLVALHDGAVLGTVNLVQSDDDDHPEWRPWLAGMVVAQAWRGHGVGSALVGALLAEARRLGVARVYLGTDGPGFFTRLDAVLHQQVRADFCFMRFAWLAGCRGGTAASVARATKAARQGNAET